MSGSVLLWGVFIGVVIFILALDLGVFHRKSHEVKVKEALIWSAVWIGVSLAFNLLIYFYSGTDLALKFFTGYLIEKSLSVDNIFVFIMIFSYFNVPLKYQHKVLFWGIIGAVVMRAVMIVAGIALIEKFDWVIYIFGVFLIFTGIKMGLEKQKEIDPDKNRLLKLLQKFVPVVSIYRGDKFFIKKAGMRLATPLFVVLIMVETTDVMFALDSIPAILSITTNTFIVFSSNIFAILGLRALYFALAGIMQIFHYLRYGLAAILAFVGVKMVLADIYHIPVAIALGVIALVLLISIVASLIKPPKEKESAVLLESTNE